MEQREERPAYVQFECRAEKDPAETLEKGFVVYKDVDWVMVTPPYSKDCYEEKAESWLAKQDANSRSGRVNRKFYDYWMDSYKAWKKDLEPPVNGMDIRNWAAIMPAQVKMLIAAGIRTIEDLACANEEGLRRIGMGGVALRAQANTWVQAASDHGPLTTKVDTLESENSVLKGTIESMQNQINILMKNSNVSAPVAPVAASVIEKTPSELYFAKFGKNPDGRMKDSTILAKLEEK